MNYKAIVIGKGFIFLRHQQAIADTGGTIIATVDIDPTKNADFLDYREMLCSPIAQETDLFVILTPNHTHAEIARACLFTGKKVLVEKPLTIFTDFWGLEGVNVVQQLHFHPMFDEICQQLRKAKHVRAIMRAYRDDEFWKSWKGCNAMSGGVVYILGSHILDLLVSALGTDFELLEAQDSMKRSNGLIKFGETRVEYTFEFLDSRMGQSRHLEIDGKTYILSTQDNLSFEGLHDRVYGALWKDRASKLKDVVPSIVLMDKIKKFGKY